MWFRTPTLSFALTFALISGMWCANAGAKSTDLREQIANLKTADQLNAALRAASLRDAPSYSDLLDGELRSRITRIAERLGDHSEDELRLVNTIAELPRRSPLADFVFLNAFWVAKGGAPRPCFTYILKFDAKPAGLRSVSAEDGWRVVAREVPVPVNGFGRELAESLEFIDYFDYVRSLAHEHSPPWSRYDEIGKPGLLSRWQETKLFQSSLPVGETDPKAELGVLKEIQKRISGTGTGIRSHPIIAGGDVYVGDRNYYPISAAEKAVLDANPYLTVDAIKNPYPGVNAAYLARHEYPSVRTYTKWRKILSPALVSEIQKAESLGILANFSDAETQRLNRLMIENLLEDAFVQAAHKNIRMDELYQRLMSIHPFGDYNGRSLRLYYQRRKDPMFITDFNHDLLLTRNEFMLEVEKGHWRRRDLIRSFSEAEALNPVFPKYYDAAELYRILADLDVPDRSRFSGLKQDLAPFLGSDRISSLIRQKRFYEAQEETRIFCRKLLKPTGS